MKNLLIVDLQDLTHIGLKSIAREMALFSSIDGGINGDDIVSFLNRYPNGVVCLDYTMLDISEEYLYLLHARFPKAAIILFSDSLQTALLKRVVYISKCFSVIFKDSSAAEIQKCFVNVSSGEQYLCKKVLSQLAEDDERSKQLQLPQLTNTEREILKLMALGKSTKDIANMRFLSVYTVMTHRKNIFRKLSVNNVHEATRFAMRAGLVDPMEYYI